VSAMFSIALTITALTALPETWRGQILISAWSICALAIIGWSASHYQDRRRLKISYDAKNPGCIWPVEFRNNEVVIERCKIARLCLESKRKLDIIGCRAVLTSIERDGKHLISGNNFKLHFCPAQEPGSNTKTIRYGTTEHLEVLKINQESGKIDIMADFDFATEQYKRLDEQASYLLRLQFSGDEIKPVVAELAVDTKVGTWGLSIKRLS
jgi:hypothetical protein